MVLVLLRWLNSWSFHKCFFKKILESNEFQKKNEDDRKSSKKFQNFWDPESPGTHKLSVLSWLRVRFYGPGVLHNTWPAGTAITVEWNTNLPCYDSTCESRVFKTFTDLPRDLPFVYGSLAASRTPFRSWLGPKNTSGFHVPGMEFL